MVRVKRFRNAFFGFRRFWSRFLQLFLGVWVSTKVEGQVPKDTPFILCPNHQSYLDIILMYAHLPRRMIFMGKAELSSWPFFGAFFRHTDVAVNRANRRASFRALQEAGQAIEEGKSIVIFPEGTIPRHVPKMKPFKNGAFQLAIEKQVPIVPMTIKNHWKLFSDPSEILGPARPGVSRVTIHPPIETKGMTEDDLVSLRQQVESILRKELQAYENR